MFEILRYRWNAEMFMNYTTQLQGVLDSGNKKLISGLYERAVSSGSKALELSRIIKSIPDDVTDALQKALSGVKEVYEHSQQTCLAANPEAAQMPAAVYHGTQDLEERLKSDVISGSMRDGGSADQRELFMDNAYVTMNHLWVGLAKQLKGMPPTADELIAAQIEACKATHKSIPSLGFRDEEEFLTWIDELESAMKCRKEEYLKSALPVYRIVTEKLGKQNIILLF